MTAINNLIKRLQKIDPVEMIMDVLKELEADLIDMNVDQLRLRGITSEGIKISSYAPYRPYTIQIKQIEGTLTNNNPDIVNLRDTEKFQDGFFLKYGKDFVEFWSRDSKTGKLAFQYGANIFGLTKENIRKISIEEIKPRLQEKYKQAVLAA